MFYLLPAGPKLLSKLQMNLTQTAPLQDHESFFALHSLIFIPFTGKERHTLLFCTIH